MTDTQNDETAQGGLAKTFSPAEIETRRYAAWERAGAFAADPNSAKAPYTIMMPPPNVTGSLHLGHALTATIQDILTRWKRMSGFKKRASACKSFGFINACMF